MDRDDTPISNEEANTLAAVMKSSADEEGQLAASAPDESSIPPSSSQPPSSSDVVTSTPPRLLGTTMTATLATNTTDTTPLVESVAPAAQPMTNLTVDRAREHLIQQAYHTSHNNAKDATTVTTTESIKLLLKDHDALKDKVSKLKSLLGRSAKAQREAKVDLDATQKRLDQTLREIERLHKKIDKLSNRPTHMELLADFETNFDRALLSVGNKHQQTGEDTASPPAPATTTTSRATGMAAADDYPQAAAVENLLMQELSESKQRVEKLQSLNNALLHRSSQLESQARQLQQERDVLSSKMAHTELEKRMAVMEAEQATKQMHEKAALLEEMQMEIDLVTKASVTANARAKQGEEMIKHVKTDKQYVHELETKVQALQEWALASSEAKTLAQERVRLLEQQLRSMSGSSAAPPSPSEAAAVERALFHQNGSFVVGAGDVVARVFSLSTEQVKSIKLSERVVLRWHFDLTSESADITFSIMRGNCDTPDKRRKADRIVKDRLVTAGAEGETEDAFTSQQSCTMEWSNARSWIRPKTVKFIVSAVVLSDEN